MGALTLTNGALLGGLALLVAPVIAHLLQRRARRPIVFPSIAFLRSTAAQQSRLHKLRRLLLLFLRVCALACVVLAFTRPVWWTVGAAAGERKVATATVFLIDASLSTSQQSGGSTVFERLKADAVRKLDDLQQGVDLAGVVWSGEQATSIFTQLTANLPELKLEVGRASPGEARANFPVAINLAARLLESHSGPKRLVILTDRQATNWKQPGAADPSDVRRPPGVELIISEIETATEPNVGLSSPSMQPERPRPGAAVEISAAIQNHSDSTRVVNAAAEWQGVAAPAIGSQSVSTPAGQSSTVTFAAEAPAQSIPAVQWRLKDTDALAGDNSLWLTATPGQGIPLVIASDDSPDDAGTAAFYLTRALAPFDEQSESRSSFSPRHVSASRLTASDLADSRLVFLAYAGVMKQESATALVAFVERGGSLVVIAGDGPADRNVQLLDETAKGSLAPWRLLSRVEAPRRSPIVLDGGRWNSRWLRDFDEPSQLALREIAFRRHWQAGAPTADAETLLTFTGGSPAVGLRHFGRGHCLLLNFSPESTTSDLGKTGTFVALMQMLASQLTQDDRDRTTFLVGDRLSFAVPQGTTGVLSVHGPDGSTTAVAASPGSSEIASGRALRSGIYRLTADGAMVSAMAVNIDPRESALAPLTVDELSELLGDAPASNSSERNLISGAAAGVQLEGGQPLWGGFLLGGLFAIALELFLLGLWRR